MKAGKLLENLPVLWEEADLTERRKLLMAMLDAVYVDTVEEKSVVAIRPKAAFRPIFEVATTREGSGIALINQTPQTQNEPEASGSCSWWRRGRVELHHRQCLAVSFSAKQSPNILRHRGPIVFNQGQEEVRILSNGTAGAPSAHRQTPQCLKQCGRYWRLGSGAAVVGE